MNRNVREAMEYLCSSGKEGIIQVLHTRVRGAVYLCTVALLHVALTSIMVVFRLPLDGIVPAVCVAATAILAGGVFYVCSVCLYSLWSGIQRYPVA